MGIQPATQVLRVAIVEDGTPFVLLFQDSWKVRPKQPERLHDYAQVRQRLQDALESHMVDLVCVAGLEPVVLRPDPRTKQKARISMEMFETAELRGVALEAAAAKQVSVKRVTRAESSKAIGSRKLAEYASDDDFFSHVKITKAMRDVVLLAVAQL